MSSLLDSKEAQSNLAAFILGVHVHAENRSVAAIENISSQMGPYRTHFEAGLNAAMKLWR